MEIERKYLLTELQLNMLVPDLTGFALETRYYLYCKDDNEVRITKRANKDSPVFTLDHMVLITDESKEFIVRRKDRTVISEEEFSTIAGLLSSQSPVERLHFKLNDQIELKIYQGKHTGLIRAEVEFDSVKSANEYQPAFEHSGEITNTPLGRDVLLANLSQQDVDSELSHY
jgi:CYTH domain-containing protein